MSVSLHLQSTAGAVDAACAWRTIRGERQQSSLLQFPEQLIRRFEVNRLKQILRCDIIAANDSRVKGYDNLFYARTNRPRGFYGIRGAWVDIGAARAGMALDADGI